MKIKNCSTKKDKDKWIKSINRENLFVDITSEEITSVYRKMFELGVKRYGHGFTMEITTWTDKDFQITLNAGGYDFNDFDRIIYHKGVFKEINSRYTESDTKTITL